MGNTEGQLATTLSLEKQHCHTIVTRHLARPPFKTDFFYLKPLPDTDEDQPQNEEDEEEGP